MAGQKTKDKVLQLLEERNGTFISGQEIADTLFITRAGIWKAVKALRDAGINIEAVSNRGYRLVKETDILSKKSIDIKLTEAGLNLETFVYDEVESTNETARKYAQENDNDAVFISDYQTNGHGRRGRVFHSPKGTGIYMSLLIHPKVDVAKATSLTCMAAVAVCRAIEEFTDFNPKIKWVNDIFLEDKKICGILTEGHTSIEDGSLEYVIVGIGINLYLPRDGFPEEIRKIAGVLFEEGQTREDVKNSLSALIIENFHKLYSAGEEADYIEDYRSRSNLIGNYVKIVSPGASANSYGKVLGIDDECHLVVEFDNGETKALSTGEVSVVKY